jgi:hypothetical protein
MCVVNPLGFDKLNRRRSGFGLVVSRVAHFCLPPLPFALSFSPFASKIDFAHLRALRLNPIY